MNAIISSACSSYHAINRVGTDYHYVEALSPVAILLQTYYAYTYC